MKSRFQTVLLLFLMTAGGSIAQAQTVKVTPLGGKTGELCAQDRALLFEDPTGVRILYDPGNTVAGGTDPRLGEVHAILITHAHPDHLGGGKLNQNPDAGTAVCTTPPTVAAPETNLAEIASAKNSAVIAGLGLASFLSLKIANVRGAAVAGCPAAGLTNEFTVPRTTPAPCTATLLSGGKRTIRMVTANQGVQIAAVAADHPNDLSATFLAEPLRTNLASNNLSAYVGVSNGFVLTFTNGLTAYLSGDTGLMQEMKTVVNGFYGAELAVINISDTFVTGPEEAAFAVNKLIQPATVLPSHTNEVSTSGGRANPGTRLERFIDLVERGRSSESKKEHSLQGRRVSVHAPLSGVTMEFDGKGQCRRGC